MNCPDCYAYSKKPVTECPECGLHKTEYAMRGLGLKWKKEKKKLK